MDDSDSPQNKIGTSDIPKVGFGGIYAPESSAKDTADEQPTARERAEDLAQSAEQGAAGVQKATSAAAKAGTGNFVGAGVDAINAGRSFRNSTKGKDKKPKNGILSSGVLKKPSSIIAIVMILAGIALLATPTLMPVHLVENIKAGLNSLFASTKTHEKKSYQGMLDAASSQEYVAINKEGCAELAMTSLKYSECEGAKDDPDIQAYYREKALEDSATAATTLAATSTATRVFIYTDRDGVPHPVDSENFDEWWEDPGFHDAITRGSLAWTGTFSGWFDDMMGQLTEDYNLTRNAFQGYYEQIENQVDSAKTYQNIIGTNNKSTTLFHDDRERLRTRDENCTLANENDVKRVTDIKDYISAGFMQHKTIEKQSSCKTTSPTDWEKTIANYEPDFLTPTTDGGFIVYNDFIWNTSTSTIVGEALTDAKEKVESYLPEFARSFSSAGATTEKNADTTCSKLFGISYFSSMVAAKRLEQAADFATKALESIDKMRAALGAESPIHQLSKQLSETGQYEYLPTTDGAKDPILSTTDKPALNGQTLQWVTTQTSVDLDDPSVVKLSLEGVFKGFVLSTATFSSCQAINISSNLLFSALSLIIGGFSSSSSGFFGESLNAAHITDEQVDEAITRAAYGFIFNPCTTDPEGNLAVGEDVGNCLALGSHYYLSKNHQVGGGSPGDETKVREFIRENRAVVAQQAEQERATRSPFDPTSSYTFLGSIINSLTPYTTSLSSLSSLFTSIGSIVSTSIGSLSPAASAITEDTLMTNVGNCRILGSGSYKGSEGLGVVGDAFCVPYMITDLSPTSGADQMTPQEVEDAIPANNFSGRDADGNPIINETSDFAHYIKYCSHRLSNFGIIDANIVKDYTEDLTDRSFLLSLAALFFPEAVKLGVENANKEDTLGWATGQYCIATDDAEINPKWELNQLFQYYMLYQRINQNRGGVAENNALPIVQGYRQENPVETPDALGAAMSGLPLENYLAIKSVVIYAALDKSTLGPNLTIATKGDAGPLTFRRSITPLTDFLLEKVLPLAIPTTHSQKQQGTTA